MTKRISQMLGAFLFLANAVYFIPLTTQIVGIHGADCNLGIILLPITIVTHLLLIPAGWTWIGKGEKHLGLLATNSLGTIWTIFWMAFLM